MTRSEIFDLLLENLRLYKADSGVPITESSRLKEDIGLDSVDLMSLVFDLEKKYSITISEEDMFRIANIGDLLGVLESSLKAT